MATIRIDHVRCIRKQELVGDDEMELYIAGQRVWEGKMERGELLNPNVTRNFIGSVGVELKERDNNRLTLLGDWTVIQTPTLPNNAPLTATSSGYHYEVFYDVTQ